MDIIGSGIITNDDLKELGINKLGDRIKIINEIKKIKEYKGEECNNFEDLTISKLNEFEYLYADDLFPPRGLYSSGEIQDVHIGHTLYYRGMSWNRICNITINNFDEYIAIRQNVLLAHKLYYDFAAMKFNRYAIGMNVWNPFAWDSTVCMFHTNAMQLEHDYEQLEYLLNKGLIPRTSNAINILNNIAVVKNELLLRNSNDKSELGMLTWDEYLAIGSFFGKMFYYPHLPRVKHALNPLLGNLYIFTQVFTYTFFFL